MTTITKRLNRLRSLSDGKGKSTADYTIPTGGSYWRTCTRCASMFTRQEVVEFPDGRTFCECCVDHVLRAEPYVHPIVHLRALQRSLFRKVFSRETLPGEPVAAAYAIHR